MALYYKNKTGNESILSTEGIYKTITAVVTGYGVLITQRSQSHVCQIQLNEFILIVISK